MHFFMAIIQIGVISRVVGEGWVHVAGASDSEGQWGHRVLKHCRR